MFRFQVPQNYSVVKFLRQIKSTVRTALFEAVCFCSRFFYLIKKFLTVFTAYVLLIFLPIFFLVFLSKLKIRNNLQIFNLLVEPNNELIDQHSIRFDSITSFARYKGYIICQISFSELSVVLPAFTCARAIGNLLRFSLELIILIPLPSDCFSI